MRSPLTALLRQWFIAGLLVWIPLAATLLLIRFLVGLLDASLLIVPASIRPDFPGFGVVLSLLLVLATGVVATNYLGGKAVSLAERLVFRIPLVRSVYGGIKKLAETIFSNSSTSFRQPVLVEYPRPGVWSVGFLTGDATGELQQKTVHDAVTVFIPTTPNPTSGFIVLVARRDVTLLDMSVEQAMKMVISLGVVTPETIAAVPRAAATTMKDAA